MPAISIPGWEKRYAMVLEGRCCLTLAEWGMDLRDHMKRISIKRQANPVYSRKPILGQILRTPVSNSHFCPWEAPRKGYLEISQSSSRRTTTYALSLWRPPNYSIWTNAFWDSHESFDSDYSVLSVQRKMRRYKQKHQHWHLSGTGGWWSSLLYTHNNNIIYYLPSIIPIILQVSNCIFTTALPTRWILVLVYITDGETEERDVQ